MTVDEWQTLVDRINASYPRQQLKAETAAVWYAELARFDAHLVTSVLRDHVRYSSFAPSCAELYQGALALLAERTPTQAAIEARGRGHGVPMPEHVKRRLEELGLRKVGRRVPADDRDGRARLEAERHMQMAALAGLDPAAKVAVPGTPLLTPPP